MMAACNGSELTWTEDVRLPDGRVITLSRWVEFKGGSSLRGDPSTESRQRFEFKHPQSGETIKWENVMDQGRLRTIAIWLNHGKPHLLTSPAYGGDSRKHNCPNPPYLLYEYTDTHWISKPLSQIPAKRLRANLTTNPLEAREEIERNKRHLGVERTSNSYTYLNGVHATPFVIAFDDMGEQTFKEEDCSRTSSLRHLIVQERK